MSQAEGLSVPKALTSAKNVLGRCVMMSLLLSIAYQVKENERDTGLEPVFPAWEAGALPDELIPQMRLTFF